MKTRMQDTAFVFTLLQICTAIAILPALALLIIFLRWWDTPYTLPRILQVLLWTAAWVSFGGMCQRLKCESAFTRRNARSLMWIAVCCGMTGLVQLLGLVGSASLQLTSAGGELLTSLVSLGVSVILPVAFLGVSAVALTLRHLLLRAMTMQQENELTI